MSLHKLLIDGEPLIFSKHLVDIKVLSHGMAAAVIFLLQQAESVHTVQMWLPHFFKITNVNKSEFLF